MISLAAVRRAGLTLLDVHNGASRRLLFRLHQTILRLERRYGRQVAASWTSTILRHQSRMDLHRLQAAIASGELNVIDAAVDGPALQLALDKAMRDTLRQAAAHGGEISVGALKQAGIRVSFNAVHPNVVLRAATKAADLVTSVPADVRAAIRTIITTGATGQLTVDQQARLIRAEVGLPRNWALAPLRMGDELRAGSYAAAERRLGARDRAWIRAAIDADAVTPTFVDEMVDRYAQSLIALRAETIARTETLDAINFGVHESWRQAIDAGELPAESRRFWIVTPDDRLCPICVEIPGMNPDGVGMDEPFDTPEGPVDDPPAPHPNCRCSVGLVLQGATASAGETA
jgi:hypothetical protein